MTSEKLKTKVGAGGGTGGELYTQCAMATKEGQRLTTWVPVELVGKERVIKVKNEQGQWEGGWVIKQTYDTWPAHKIDGNFQKRLKPDCFAEDKP
jgi:hypothetical protein